MPGVALVPIVSLNKQIEIRQENRFTCTLAKMCKAAPLMHGLRTDFLGKWRGRHPPVAKEASREGQGCDKVV